MIKLQDFAKECGVTDRQIQRQLKKYEKELEGHFDRQGQNGTWLDDEACKFLRSRMKSNPIIMVDDQVNDLQAKIAELERKLEEKEKTIDIKNHFIDSLQAREEIRKKELEDKSKQLLAIESKTQEQIQQAVKAAEEKLKNDLQTQFNQQLADVKKDAAEQAKKEAEEKFRNLGLIKRLLAKF